MPSESRTLPNELPEDGSVDLTKARNTLIAVACGIALGVFFLWFGQFAWQRIQEHDAEPRRAGVKNQLMRRKSAAMDEALQAMLRGNLVRVNAAAVRMRRSAAKIDGFLSTEVYDRYGEDFFGALDDLLAATEANDREGSKEAILRLEKSCIDCHFLINPSE